MQLEDKQTDSPKYNLESSEIQEIEARLLFEGIFMKYGYDFRNYSHAHLTRRINQFIRLNDIKTISELQEKILWNPSMFSKFLKNLSINVTEMFRDPGFYLAFREKVVPILSTYAHIKVWHAGCSTGEEVYSMAILFKEENLLNRTQIYATDFNKTVLDIAKQGIYPAKEIEQYNKNYKEAGGKKELSDYYTSKYGSVLLDKSLSKKIVFADHNLVTDDVFAEVNLIICRNVLIYFNKELQNHVISLFDRSLTNHGILCLGSKESLKFTDFENHFITIDKVGKIYKKNLIL